MATGLRLVTERSTATGQPVIDAENGEELVHVQPAVSIGLGNRTPEFPGTLYISTKQVVWLSDTDMAKGYAVDFLSVSLHAVSRDPEAYPSPCIYTQIFCECAELNPDPIEEEEEEHNWIVNADQMQDDAAENEELEWAVSPNPTHSIGANGNHDLAYSVVQLQINDQRFEDAEEMESDNSNDHN